MAVEIIDDLGTIQKSNLSGGKYYFGHIYDAYVWQANNLHTDTDSNQFNKYSPWEHAAVTLQSTSFKSDLYSSSKPSVSRTLQSMQTFLSCLVSEWISAFSGGGKEGMVNITGHSSDELCYTFHLH